jgi:hypothetical protein
VWLIAVIVGCSVAGLVVLAFAVMGCIFVKRGNAKPEQDPNQQGMMGRLMRGLMPARAPPMDAGKKVIHVDLTRPYDYAAVRF